MHDRQPLKVELEEPNPETAVFRLSGDLYGNREGYDFQEFMRALAGQKMHLIVIDLARVRKVDSSGFGILVAGLVSTMRAGGHFGVAAVPHHLESLLRAMGLLKLMVNAPSVEEAISQIQAQHV